MGYPCPVTGAKSRLRSVCLHIAIFDYKITRNNPIGSCHLAMLRALAAEHEFTVFAVEFENPCPEKIQFVRVPSPMRPLALLFVVYHFMAPFCYLLYRLRGGAKFDFVQALRAIWLSATSFTRTFAMACTSSTIGGSPEPGACEVGSAGSIIAPRPDGRFYLSPSETGRGSIARPGKGAKSGIPLYREQADCIAESHQPGAVTNAGRL